MTEQTQFPPFWYNLLLSCIKPLYRSRVKKRSGHLADYQDEVRERFGEFQTAKNQNVIWFHAVSVGETNAAQPLIAHYLKLGQAVLVTNTTRTGQARAKSLFLGHYPELFQAVFLPVDQRDLIEQFIAQYQPRILLLMETELWPNLLACVHQRQIPQLLVNARLSEKSAKGYAKFKRLTAPMLQQLDFIAAQDQASKQRFVDLGKSSEQVEVLGNVKFDMTMPKQFVQQAEQLKQEWSLEDRQIIVLASTHAPEEAQILNGLKPHLQQNPQLLCIFVPRHPERFQAVFYEIKSLDLKVQRRSLDQAIDASTQVYLADSMGEMWLWFALAQVAYVGGSLNEPGGGHNILEPIATDVATVLGKNYFNFQSIVDEFVSHDAVVVATDAKHVVEQMMNLINDPSRRQQQVSRAQQILHANQGAVERHIVLIDRYLKLKNSQSESIIAESRS